MGEMSTLAKAMFILAFVAVLAVMMFGSQGPTLSTPPSAPVFINPWDAQSTFSYKLSFDDAGPNSSRRIIAHGSDNGCSQSTYWNCIKDPNGYDGNNTYVSMNNSVGFPNQFDDLIVNVTGWPTNGEIQSGLIELSCRSNTTSGVHINISISEWISIVSGGSGNTYLSAINQNTFCKSGNDFTNLTIYLSPPSVIYNLNTNAHPPNLMMFVAQDFNMDVQISTISLTIVVSSNASCSGANFFSNTGCSIQNFINWLQNLGTAIVRAIGWLFGWFQIAGTFFYNFFLIIVWLYAIPGMPSVIQLFVDAYLTMLFGILMITFLKILRGGSP
ncbi:MAG: hypothetical protein E6L00_03440 [Thaumarchaeota archaeon]|nr:MAG: hypothetical protein E6L00_03440 [Nitrososphaerota archaeon]